MKINFISSLGVDEYREMYTKSDNVEIISGTETSDAINELFKKISRRTTNKNKRKQFYIRES